MPTVLDQATVFSEFTRSIPSDISAPLRPHIAGPQAVLHRYSNPTEKAAAVLGEYDPDAPATYNWPGKAATGVVDLDYVKVYIDDALLQYYTEVKGSGDTIAPTASYLNRINTNGARGFKTNTATYPRIAALKDRDVAVGDIVHLVDGANEQWTSVADLIADPVNASIAAATSDAANAIAQPNSYPGAAPSMNATGGGASGGLLGAGTYQVRYGFAGPFGETWSSAAASVVVSAGNIPRATIPALPTGATSAKLYVSPVGGTDLQCTLYASGITGTTYDMATDYVPGGSAYIPTNEQTSGTSNGVTVTAVSSTNYNGSATGDLSETYTIVVTQASTGGNLTTGLLQVTSASGRDDVASVTPSASGVATAIGARGLTMTWTRASDNFVVGQTWQITVRQVWAVPVPTSAGTYTGTSDVVYIVRVSRGGLYADATKPQITVTTDRGIDQSGPTTVSAAATNVAIGTLGALIQFSNTGLRKGDIYYVSVTGPSEGAYKTIVLANNLTTALQASSDMTLTLFIKKNLEIVQERQSSPPDLNWEADANGITLNDGIDAQDPTLTDGGVPFWVPIKGGTAYAHYREWSLAYASKLFQVNTPEDVMDLFPTSYNAPDSVLPYALWKATQNSNGQTVLFTGIHDPTDTTEWSDMLAILEGYTNIVELVPLTRDTAVLDLYRAHVVERADDAIGGEWRHAWFNLLATSSVVVVDDTTASDGETVMATLADNPGASGTQYTYLACTTGNADFQTNGVAAGDIVRFLYGIDAFGTETYSEFVVASVVNEDTLILSSGHTVAVAVAQRVEVWRNLTANQVAANVVAPLTGAAINKRFRYVWPDQITDDDENVVEGYFLCAALAAYVGGIAPQQGLRNLEIGGFSNTPRSTEFFNNQQLNTLGDAGCFVVSTDPTSGLVFTRYARTPDLTAVDTREEATVRLDDALRYLLYGRVEQFFGKSNANDTAVALIDAELKAAGQHAISDSRVERIGPMAVTVDVVSLRISTTAIDSLEVAVTVTRGTPLNNATITLTV